MIKEMALGVVPARVARSAPGRATAERNSARLAWARLDETVIHSQRAIAVKRAALRWLRLLVSIAAASPGSSGNFSIVAQQIALVGFWQWLSLVACLTLSTPLVTQVQGVGAALAQVAGAARPGPTTANVLERHPAFRSEEILR